MRSEEADMKDEVITQTRLKYTVFVEGMKKI